MAPRALIGWKPTSHSTDVASVRIRCLNPVSKLVSDGYPVEVFRNDRLSSYQAVVYSKIYDEASYAEALRLKQRGAKVIFDLCDNHFYNQHSTPELERRAQRLKKMIQVADRLVASNSELALVMRKEAGCDADVTVIGDAVESSIPSTADSLVGVWHRWRAARLAASFHRGQSRTRLVWFGNHGVGNADGGMLDLIKLRPIVESLNTHHPLSLTVISNSWKKYFARISHWRIPTHYVSWHPDTFLPLLEAHDIAVIPATLNPFTRCKSNNRLALAVSKRLAVVADPVPSYLEFGEVTFLGDWERGLVAYMTDLGLRQAHVEGGRAILERHYTLRQIAEAWRRLFDDVLGGAFRAPTQRSSAVDVNVSGSGLNGSREAAQSDPTRGILVPYAIRSD